VGIYTYQLTATSKGGISVAKTISINMTTLNDTAASLANFVPYFDGMIVPFTLNISENEGATLHYSSPEIKD